MKPTSMFARALVKQTVELRGRALTNGGVTARLLGTVWPQNLSIGDFPVRKCVAVNRMLKCMLAGSEFGVLDVRSKLLDDALGDAPVPVKGTNLRAFPKAYSTMQMTEHVSYWVIRAGATEESKRSAAIVRSWIATHEGPGLPFREVTELETLPEWLNDLPFDEVERAYQLANTVRCEAITGDHLRLAALSSPEYVPRVLVELAKVTEIEPETLRNAHSFAACLALAEVAGDLKGDR